MDKTQISLPLPDTCSPLRYETMWATGPHGRRTLLNSSFFLPLAVGDEVETIDRDQREVITGVVAAGPMTLSVCVVDDQVTDEEQVDMTEAWRRHGARWTEGGRGLLLTVWEPAITADRVFDVITSAIGDRPGWHVPFVYGPQDRKVQMHVQLSRASPRSTL